MRPPAFWSNPPDRPGLPAHLLRPLSALCAAATARRVAGPGHRAAVPVICVGNLTAGGTGKTPVAVDLVQRLLARGRAPHVLSRGYGGRLSGVRVDPGRHGAADVGDEPLLLSAFAPVWVGSDRAGTADAAVAAGADVLVMDDGFQNPGLVKDLSIVVVDAAAGFGNGRVIPAGPLREPVAAGLARADLLVTVGDAEAQARHDARWAEAWSGPRLRASLAPLGTGMDWRGLRALAFAGIGRPEKFFDTLAGLGVDLAGTRALDDHQPLTPALLSRLRHDAAALGAQLVTTEKDAFRLPASERGRILTLPVRLQAENDSALVLSLSRIGL